MVCNDEGKKLLHVYTELSVHCIESKQARCYFIPMYYVLVFYAVSFFMYKLRFVSLCINTCQ